jgi:hypothetical protein
MQNETGNRMITNPNATYGTTSLNDILKLTAPSTPGPSGFRGVLGSIVGGIGNILMPGMGTIIGNAIGGSALGATMPGLGGQTTQYLALQQEIENEQIAFETASTVLKVRHDAASTAIQNMK